MRKRMLFVSVLAVGLLALILAAGGGTQPAAEAQPHAPAPVPEPEGPPASLVPACASSPDAAGCPALLFVENVGQFDDEAAFQARWGNTTLHLTPTALWFTVVQQQDADADVQTGVHLMVSFPGANPQPRLEGWGRLDTHVSYFAGDDPAQWRADVPTWRGVRYVDLYPGVDLEIGGPDGGWTWRLVCRAGGQSSIQDVALRVEGARNLALKGRQLRLDTDLGAYALPLVELADADESAAAPSLAGKVLRAPFARPAPDSRAPGRVPILDDLLYATFLGGSGQDWGHSVALDGEGDAYLAGSTGSTDFPATTGAFSTTLSGGTDAFIAKINPAGNGAADLVWATFLGGTAGDYAAGIAVDSNEDVYVTGWSNLLFPDTPGAFADCDAGGAFVTKLNNTGSALLFSGCLAGINIEGSDLALDGAGRAYVSGQTGDGLPTTPGAFQETHGGGAFDAFLAVVSADGAALDYVSYVGGNDNECTGSINGCTLDLDPGANHVYLGGDTESPNFPTSPGAYDTVCGTDGACNNSRDVFFVKLDPAGGGAADLLYGTFLGHDGLDSGGAIAADGDGYAHLTGSTSSHSFPTTAGAYDTSHNGGFEDAFYVKVNPAGGGAADLLYGTFLGGGGPGDDGYAIDADGDGHAYVAGSTNSTDFPTTPDGYDTTLNSVDAFLLKLDPAGNGQADLLYGTFLGGDNGGEATNGCGLVADGSGNAYLTGETGADDYPTSPGAYDTAFNGGTHDAFITRLPLEGGAGYRLYLPVAWRNY